jgi:hypothetical protein
MHRLFLASLLLATACSESPIEATEGTGGTGGTGGDAGTGGVPMLEVGETCIAFCAKAVVDCGAFDLDGPQCEQFCQQDLDAEYEYATACGTASEGVFECVAELETCDEVEAWKAQSPPESFPCQPAVAVYDELVVSRVCLPPQ